MKRRIDKVAVLGSGTMGSQIACHFANVGVDVLLLDIVPRELNEVEQKKGLTLENKPVRNRIVNESLKRAMKLKPAPLYKKEFASRIQTGNFDDDLAKISEADWVIEVIVERRDIKASLFEKVEQHRRPGSLITTNTSGIPIHSLLEGRSDDFKKHFCGTHFFNPPRYLELLEIIPSAETDSEVIDFLDHYGDVVLGKTTIVCKDSPAFIGNRIGVYAIMLTFKLMEEVGLSIEAIDALTGKAVGRPKSATFRTTDVVGLDVMAHVSTGVYDNCPEDEERDVFKLPEYVSKMLENKWLGDKTKQGFYKKVKDEKGKSQILAMDYSTLDYKPATKPQFAIIDELKSKSSITEKLKVFGKLEPSDDKASTFYRLFYYRTLAYCSNRIPEVADEVYKVDAAVKAGFGWEAGPFETWDAMGFVETIEKMTAAGHPPADWIIEMKDAGFTSFYKIEDGLRKYYDQRAKEYKVIPGTESLIFLDNYREHNTVWNNDETNIIHIGDGVLVVEFVSKSNTLGAGVLAGINKALDLAEATDNDYVGVILGNEAGDFSLGANLGQIAMAAFMGQKDIVVKAIHDFQKAVLRLRYSPVPVIAAPRGRTLGGGTELCMHADGVQIAAETYMGLVEIGVGLIPGGCGTKEFVLRAAKEYTSGDPKAHHLLARLMTIAQAKVATSAHQAFDLGYLEEGRDQVTINKHRLLSDAKHRVMDILAKGYNPPAKPQIEVLGRNTLSMFYTAINQMRYGNYITDYEEEIARKLAYVMTGGDLSLETKVSEDYLLELERGVFAELITNKKTLERIESVLKRGKPLRN